MAEDHTKQDGFLSVCPNGWNDGWMDRMTFLPRSPFKRHSIHSATLLSSMAVTDVHLMLAGARLQNIGPCNRWMIFFQA